jgi:hypothetical protein
MVAKAYIFIETISGTARAVHKSVSKFSLVKICSLVSGPYDVIAYIEAPHADVLNRDVAKKIHSIRGVVRTVTSVVTA